MNLKDIVKSEIERCKTEGYPPYPDPMQDALAKLYEKAYKNGYKDAISNYAIWRDGQQYVGVLARPLKEIIEEVEKSSIPIQY